MSLTKRQLADMRADADAACDTDDTQILAPGRHIQYLLDEVTALKMVAGLERIKDPGVPNLGHIGPATARPAWMREPEVMRARVRADQGWMLL